MLTHGYNVGIVSGSDIEYIVDQCSSFFDDPEVDLKKLDIYPCNGTKHYRLKHDRSLDQIYSKMFSEEVGSKLYSEIIYSCMSLLSNFGMNDWSEDLPLTGNFIDCRGSVINFCPIGRNATGAQRKIWKFLDSRYQIRSEILKTLCNSFSKKGVTFKLGGETSIDIFPDGWDKTYVLKNFSKSDNIWFVGDRCVSPGNDSEIYESIHKKHPGQSYETSGPENTIQIIENKILKKQEA